MKIIEPVYKLVMSFCTMSLIIIGVFVVLGDFQSLERQFLYIMLFDIIAISILLVFQYLNKIKSTILNKKLPIFIKVPISESLIISINQSIGFFGFIMANLSLAITNVLWIAFLSLGVLWLLFIHHPHIWLKDSFDLQDRLKNPEKYKKNLVNGFFQYPNDLDGFIYQCEKEQQLFTVKWIEILNINVQNIDLFTHLEIKLSILTEENIIQIYESTVGYPKFYGKLVDNLKNFESLKMLVYLSGDYKDSINVFKK